MRYRTELMEEILTSPQAQKIIDYVSPIYGESYVFLWLFQAIGMILDEGESFPEEFANQVTPVTATWSLEFWEKEYGITPDPDWTIEQRRIYIIDRITSRKPINPKRIKDLVSEFYGFDSEIIENSAKNTFTVLIRGYVTNIDKIKAAINEIKPAHLLCDYKLEAPTTIENYHRIHATAMEKYKVVVKANDIDVSDVVVLATDESGNVLTDENGAMLAF